MLAREAEELTVGQVIRCIQGPIRISANDATAANGGSCLGDYAFGQLWQKVNGAVEGICDSTTVGELVEYERANGAVSAPNYSI